jgi:phosphonate transport system substrate-binding protein
LINFVCDRNYIFIEVSNKVINKEQEIVIKTGGKGPALNFGITSNFADNNDVKRAFSPFIHYISENLDRKIRLVIALDHEQLIEFLDEGKIHFGSFSTNTYINARKKLGKKIIYLLTGILIQASVNTPFYRGVVFSTINSGIKKITELKDVTFAFTNKQSTSGYKYCLSKFLSLGINPKKDFKKILFLGDHRSTLSYVAEGKADAGVAVEEVYEYFVINNPGKLRKIGYTEKIPTPTICISNKFPKNEIKALTKTLLSINEETRNKKNQLVVNKAPRFLFKAFVRKSEKFYDIVSKVLTDVEKYEKSKF